MCHMRHLGIPEFREMWEECLIEGRSVSDAAPGNSGIPGNVGRLFLICFRVSYPALWNSGIPGNVGIVCDCISTQGKVYL